MAASTSKSHGTAPYTLYTYSADPVTHRRLPVLDPAGLYAASLLRSSGSIVFNVRPPSVWLHKTLPRLEYSQVGSDGKVTSSVVIAEGIRQIERFVASLPTDGEAASETSRIGNHGHHAALEAHLATYLEPLIYGAVLFPPIDSGSTSSPSSSSSQASFVSLARIVFDKVTFPAYSSGLSFPSSRTIPHRLRERCQASLYSSGSSNSLRKALMRPSYEPLMSTEEKQRQEEREAQREQMRPLKSSGGSRILRFGRAEKEVWKGEFTRQRMIDIAREALDPVLSFVEKTADSPQDSYPPALLHLFALLAPLVLANKSGTTAADSNAASEAGLEALRSHPIAQLLSQAGNEGEKPSNASQKSYAMLASCVNQIWEQVWADHFAALQASSWSQVALGSRKAIDAMPSSASAAQHGASPVAASSRAGSPAGLLDRFYGSLFGSSSPQTPKAQAGSKKNKKDDEPQTEMERRAARRLRIGRALWTATALLGTFGWLFLSGVVSIDLSGEGGEFDEEEEEYEEEEEAEAEEDGGDEDAELEDEGEDEDGEGYIVVDDDVDDIVEDLDDLDDD